MNLLVIRHGIAIEREDWQGDDELRPLTDDGVRKMRKAAIGLHAIIDVIDVVAASPLVRAQQTARLIVEPFGLPDIETLDALKPEADVADLLPWLADFGDDDTIAVRRHVAGETMWIVVRLRGSGAVDLSQAPAVGQEPDGVWQTVRTTEDPAFVEQPAPIRIAGMSGGPRVDFQRPGGVIFRIAPPAA